MKSLVSIHTHHEGLYATPISVFDTRELAEAAIQKIGTPIEVSDAFSVDFVRELDGREYWFWLQEVDDNLIDMAGYLRNDFEDRDSV